MGTRHRRTGRCDVLAVRTRSLSGVLFALGLVLSACAPAPAAPTAAPTQAPAAAPTQAPAAKPTTAPAAAPTAAAAAAPTAAAAAAKPTTGAAAAAGTKPGPLSADFNLDLRYGVLAGLTGDGAAF